MLEHGEGTVSEELVDSELMEIYGWSWDQLVATPHYVRTYCYQVQQMKAAKRDQDQTSASQSTPGQERISHA